jgi:hypothetical protein
MIAPSETWPRLQTPRRESQHHRRVTSAHATATSRRLPTRAAHATWLILRGATWRVALPVALVVGTVLAAVNQGADLINGDADGGTAARTAANFQIPYVVSSVGYLSGPRPDDRAGEGA